VGSTRREFLARSGALAAAALAAGGAVALPGGAAPASGLTDARRRAFAALAESVVTGPSMRLDPANAEAAVDAFGRAYSAWPADRRQHADETLDQLAAAGVGAVPERAPRLRDARPTGAERRDLALVEASVALVAAVVGQPDGGHDSEVI
jgi:hypothetical protein